jgi:hypothetical protein
VRATEKQSKAESVLNKIISRERKRIKSWVLERGRDFFFFFFFSGNKRERPMINENENEVPHF